jgi:DNA-binding beta-propeller fold protein YncE
MRTNSRDVWYAYYKSTEKPTGVTLGRWEYTWYESTGTQWESVKYSNKTSNNIGITWADMKNALSYNAENGTGDIKWEKSGEVIQDFGESNWTIRSEDNIFTDNNISVIVDKKLKTYYITAKSLSNGTEYSMSYLYTNYTQQNIEIWAYYNPSDSEHNLKSIFVRNYSTGYFPEGQNGTKAGSTLNHTVVTTPQTGTIIVTSSPGNASVYLDNIYKGSTTATTSLQISGVSVGQHTVKVTKPNYNDYSEIVIVTVGGTHNVNATLTPISQTGTIIVTSTPGDASVYLDNIYKGSTTATTSLQISGVSVGEHWLEVKKPKYIDYYGYVIVTAGGTHNVNATLSIGSDDYKFFTHWGHSGSGNGQLYGPSDVAVDSLGNVYVADAGNGRIQKFYSNGTFLAKWGSFGEEDGQFNSLSDIAFDSSGNVYVADAGYDRIQKFYSNGTFLAKWGSRGEEDGQFDFPSGLAVDSLGFVYIADANNERIQKFYSNGTFLAKWGSYGEEDGQLYGPSDVAVDSSDNVYVADSFNNRIQKFYSNGTFSAKWGSIGDGDGQFFYPSGVAVDSSGNVYVTDQSRIQKFNSTGNFLAKWGSEGTENGNFIYPRGIAVDSSGNVYVADTGYDRIQKFNSTGKFLTKWGSDVSLNGQLCSPKGVAVDSSGNVYVADRCNDRIQKFNSAGAFLLKWGSEGTENGQFEDPTGIAVDSSGNVYVADEVYTDELYRIQKFSSTGKFLAKWGSNVSGYENVSRYGIFDTPHGIAVDSSGNVYAVQDEGESIWKFSSNGTLLGEFGWGPINPSGVSVDSSGKVYVADTWGDAIWKFSSNGTLLRFWGSHGTEDGQFDYPSGIAVDSSGNIYVADTYNQRIQKFSSNGTVLAIWGQRRDLWINFWGPSGVAVDSSGNIYVADAGNRIWKISRSFSPTKIGVFRPSAHMFYLKNGTTTTTINWGTSTDLPVTGDWNGDGRAEVGVFRPPVHTFYLKNGTTTTTINWGASTDLPVTGDWNGDGRTDVGVFRPSAHTFYLKNGTTTTAISWGVSTDLPVTGDWNGDGRTEVGVFRPSTHMFYLKNGTTTTAISWGVSTDLPVSGKW